MRYESIFRCKWLGDGSETLSEIAEKLEQEIVLLKQMEADGIVMEATMEDDYAFLVTENEEIAKKYSFYECEEEEYEEDIEIIDDGDED
jgi:hypothetical protein